MQNYKHNFEKKIYKNGKVERNNYGLFCLYLWTQTRYRNTLYLFLNLKPSKFRILYANSGKKQYLICFSRKYQSHFIWYSHYQRLISIAHYCKWFLRSLERLRFLNKPKSIHKYLLDLQGILEKFNFLCSFPEVCGVIIKVNELRQPRIPGE